MRLSSGFHAAISWLMVGTLGSPLGADESAASGGAEIGRPILRHYAPGEHLRGRASQRVVQDGSGLVYLANDNGLLTYDGAIWANLPLTDDAAGIRQFAVAEDGTVYLAGAGVLGFMRGSGKEAGFVSLQEELPPGARNIDEMRCAVAIGRTVYFSDDEKILIWREGRFTVIPYPTVPRAQGTRLHRVGDTVYATALDRPLVRVVRGMVETVADDPVLRENRIVTIEAGADGTWRLLTAERGFFQVGAGGEVTRWETPMNSWLAGRRVFCALRLPDGSRVVGFSAASGDGGMRFAPDGRYLGALDTSIGLLVKAVRDFYLDREGGLWLGMDAGAARLLWPSPLSLFDAFNGLGRGAVSAVGRQDGVLYAATEEGFFRLVPADGNGRAAAFERIHNKAFHALAAHPGGLLVLGSGELFTLTPEGLVSVVRTPADGGRLLRSRRDPARVWIGTSRGVRAVRHSPQGWIDEGGVDGFDEPCRELSEATDGSLWVVTGTGGLRHLVFSGEKLSSAQVERPAGGPGSGGLLWDSRLAEVGGETALVSPPDHSLRRYDPRAKAFVSVPGWMPLPGGGAENCRAVAVGAGGTLWVAGPDGVWQISGTDQPARRLSSAVTGTVGAVHTLWEEEAPSGTVLWVGGEMGLARVEVAHAFPPPVPFTARLNALHVSEGEELAPRHEAPVFRFYAPRQLHSSEVRYQTRLVGYEREWTEWSVRRERTVANLPAGRYRFEARARDADGVVTEPVTLAFVVLPPWWASWWALGGYGVALLGLIAGVVQWRTRALRRRASELESVVQARTAELAHQNTELVRLHQLELSEKITARLSEEKARLEVLRYQLNPHFLFNTLASISAALPGAGSTARTMVERLADFCRLTLHRGSEEDWTTLGEEMQLLRAYLEIEQSRWGDLLDVEISGAPELAGERLPHFLLLPLVENALKYGHATSVDRVGLRVAASREADGTLRLEIANTGEWVEPKAGRSVVSLGIGLDNLRERLARYYPRAHRLDITHGGGWVTVTLHIILPRTV